LRPLELRLAHFGPYRDEAVLDFETLDRLFLVCGPTGAGKTTLFDALTYALYERTPGTRGNLSDQLASHHAPEGSVPRVSLRFSIGSQQWRVTRHLRHRVMKQRGEGWRDQEAQVVLEVKKESGWETIGGKRSEINQRLEDLIGLSAEEFSKIVVLPQGDFQRFLEASSSDREKMLQKLFPVEAYERVVELLRQRAKTVEDARKRWEDRWDDLQSKLGSADADRSVLEAAWAEADARLRQATQAEAHAAEELVRQQGQWNDWRALVAKRQEKLELEAKRPSYDAERTAVERARLARPFGVDLDRQEKIRSEGVRLRTTQDEFRVELESVEKELGILAAGAAETGLLEARLAELLRERGALEHQRTLWNQAQELQAGEETALVEERAAQADYDSSKDARLQAEAGVALPPEGPNWEDALSLLDTARSDDQQAKIGAEARTLQLALEKELEAAAREQTSAGERAKSASQEAVVWDQVVSALKAADLAATLESGQPCPVCGSLEHPEPAGWPQASAEAPRRLQEALAEQTAANQKLAVANARHEELSRRVTELPEASLSAKLDPAETALRLLKVQGQVEALRTWSVRQAAAQRHVEEALAQENGARERWQAAIAARETLTNRRQALWESVRENPAPRLETLAQEETGIRRRLELDQQKAQVLGRQQQTLHTRVDELEKQLTGQREEYKRLQTSLEQAVAALGWSLDDAKSARMEEAALTALERGLNAYDAQTQRLEGELASLDAKFPQGAPPPLEGMAESLEALRKERVVFEAQAKEKEFALRDRDRIEEELREVLRQKNALEADFQRLVPLFQALDGRNRLNLKLTTWVLIQALEQVTQSATHRLAAMSGGRYALKVQTQGLDGRRDWGLDLAVIDSYTGQERAVGTLSGGEKFMTSISLALGLADVIQERSGGLRLEAIFIDEGFGTLDDQSLDGAMAILHDLGQHRSVGIISHVAELRQRINSRVEVVKGRNGSTLKVS